MIYSYKYKYQILYLHVALHKKNNESSNKNKQIATTNTFLELKHATTRIKQKKTSPTRNIHLIITYHKHKQTTIGNSNRRGKAIRLCVLKIIHERYNFPPQGRIVILTPKKVSIDSIEVGDKNPTILKIAKIDTYQSSVPRKFDRSSFNYNRTPKKRRSNHLSNVHIILTHTPQPS